MRDERLRYHLCEPCKGEMRKDDARFRHLPDHARCQGGDVWCECWTEVLIQAEEMTE